MHLSFDDLGGKLSKKIILESVPEEQIYRKFAKDYPKKTCHSPFRKDPNPSFGFYEGRNGSWQWKDQGGNGDHGNVFDYVAKIYNTDLRGALKIIADTFLINPNSNRIVLTQKFDAAEADKENKRGRSLIQAVRRDLDKYDYEWWNSILIHPGLMEFYLIRGAQEIWVDKQLYWFHKVSNPIFYYVSPVSRNIKAYRPLETDKKRRFLSSQNPLTDVQGYWQCNIKQNPGQPLLLTKSLKECAFFRAFGINAMANTAEHTGFTDDFIRHIKKYCWPIIYLGDNDRPGMKAAIKIRDKHQIPPMLIPKKWGAKDPTDLWIKEYRKVYDLLNDIYDYFKQIRITGPGTLPPRRIYHPGEAA